MRLNGIGLGLALALAGCATAPPDAASLPERTHVPLDRDSAVRALTADRLILFESDAELRRYLRAVERVSDKRWAGRPRPNQFAQAEEVPCQVPEDCPQEASDASDITVTSARAPSNPSITNNQKAGVDEGDIVKQIGQFLLVLQDGRIFVVDTKPGGGEGLAVADRANVYRDARQDTWYDEMLVHEDRIVVTGYSYDESATELSVFRLDPRGRIAHEGTFYISSDDYYESKNYATRIAGGRLIVYTPIDVDEFDEDEPYQWPVIRRWMPGVDRDAARRRGTRLLDARSIYRPVQPTLEPIVHTVSVCPLGKGRADADLRCRTTGFVGPARREWYVSPTDAYLWVTPGSDDFDQFRRGAEKCLPGRRPPAADTVPAMLFRVPLSVGEPSVIATRGVPINQFSLETYDGWFRALVAWPEVRCRHDWDAEEDPNADPSRPLTYFATPLSRFSPIVENAPERAFTALPSPLRDRIENRFTERYLVYGGREGWSSRPPDAEEEKAVRPTRVVAVPVARPDRPTLLEVPHNVIRLERAGDNMVATGYRDGRGLDISLVGLDGAPRIASAARLAGRFESEGRSHAFNSLIRPDGVGLMGLPTVAADEESGRYPWYSDASDVSFLSADAAGRLHALGELLSRENRPGADDDDDDDDKAGAGYECEVSCIDWYGNSRPIFTDGRVFGLTGVELVEGRVEAGRISEVRRLDLTVPASR